ncbi:hypothetical protein [Sphingomonas kyeonggiensis]|uniref:Uncharacterized protein n=1 Tax=Sphingomonas kyeonggiensis TaxID=1268553 RepID=A0A7W6NVE5_9SPHN|nr:hypothetical protein [Sphingomonas kyeonggiensis]MBB4097999.1 hypothetical protein [Sphingomonas kyeonggiensis]
MGAAKSNPLAITAKGPGRFDSAYQAEVEADLGLHHSVAFERVTGWPVHGTYVGDEAIRFHNEDGHVSVFDVRGIMTAAQHGDSVIQPLVMRGNWPRSAVSPDGHLAIGCTCMGEEGIAEARIALDEDRLARAQAAIRANKVYLNLTPTRAEPRFSASALRRYAFGQCVVFAEALARVRDLTPVAMLPTGIADWAHIEPDQMQHSAVLHPDGELEDVWGKAPAARIAARYGITQWNLSEDAHRAMIDDGIAHRPEVIDEINAAELVIRAQAGAMAD